MALGFEVFWNTRFRSPCFPGPTPLAILIQWFRDGAQELVFLVRASCDPYQGKLENMALDNRICLRTWVEVVGAGRDKQVPRPQDLESQPGSGKHGVGLRNLHF